MTGLLEEVVDQSVPSRFFGDNCTFHTHGTKIGAHLLNWTNRHEEKGLFRGVAVGLLASKQETSQQHWHLGVTDQRTAEPSVDSPFTFTWF